MSHNRLLSHLRVTLDVPQEFGEVGRRVLFEAYALAGCAELPTEVSRLAVKFRFAFRANFQQWEANGLKWPDYAGPTG